jgi:hypothetical protein
MAINGHFRQRVAASVSEWMNDNSPAVISILSARKRFIGGHPGVPHLIPNPQSAISILSSAVEKPLMKAFER